MLDIKFIRENPELVKEGAGKKKVKVDVDKVLKLDEERRGLLTEVEEMRAKKNRANERMKEEGSDKKEIIKEMKEISEKHKEMEKKYKELEEELFKEVKKIPNLPFPEVPVGESDEENVVLRREGEKKDFEFEVKDYLGIAEKTDTIDLKRAAKVSGARFGILKHEAVELQFALVRMVMDITAKYGFIPILPPVMIKKEMMEGMGYVERGGDEIYEIEKDNFYLVGTSEQVIGPIHSGEVFEKNELPKRYVGYSSCFRREAGSYGKDTKGILRVHQFEKVEMFSFSTPEKSKEEHEMLLQIEEELMKLLELPYQVIDICTADLGDPAAKKYDIEAWMPGQGEYRETHSTSNCTDFQSRRLNIRYKEDGKTNFVHTLNGTALAIGRILIALYENHQQEDGSVRIPEALLKYLSFEKIRIKK